MDLEHRAGHYVRQQSDYRAFIPRPLPPEPGIEVDPELLALLSRADLALGRLDGSTHSLPNPDLFVAMYVRKEAVLSSQIEGTQASLVDLLEFEAEAKSDPLGKDVDEVVNYVKAMNHGLRRLQTLPLSLRLMREIHAELLSGARGGSRNPGEFRSSQNWIGPAGCTLATALFVPPPPAEMATALGDLEAFLHAESPMPVLLRAGLAHAQFETIHPFLDGNGRIGRLLITFLLCERQVLRLPLLYLSFYFMQHRAEYYERLQAVRERGDWEGWLRFFLRGVGEVAEHAALVASEIVSLRERTRAVVGTKRGSGRGLQLLESLFFHPVVTASGAAQRLGLTFANAGLALKQFQEFGILVETTGQRRNRIFAFREYLDLLEAGLP